MVLSTDLFSFFNNLMGLSELSIRRLSPPRIPAAILTQCRLLRSCLPSRHWEGQRKAQKRLAVSQASVFFVASCQSKGKFMKVFVWTLFSFPLKKRQLLFFRRCWGPCGKCKFCSITIYLSPWNRDWMIFEDCQLNHFF